MSISLMANSCNIGSPSMNISACKSDGGGEKTPEQSQVANEMPDGNGVGLSV